MHTGLSAPSYIECYLAQGVATLPRILIFRLPLMLLSALGIRVLGMGEFVAVSAFRTEDASGVLAATGRFFSAYEWPTEPADDVDPMTEDDVVVFPAVNGWTTVSWPTYFSDLPAVEFVSRDLGTVASTVRVHDGDYWTHSLFRNGDVLDRFATTPDYFTDDPAEIARLTVKYAGQPAVVAEAVGRPAEQIAPYFARVDLADTEDEEGYHVEEPELGKAFPDDEHELADPWVFVDFWRRLGPRYPDLSEHVGRLRLAPGWLGKLPAGDAEL